MARDRVAFAVFRSIINNSRSISNAQLPANNSFVRYSSSSYLAMDKKLFTPGPLSTSPTVKEAMLRDVGSRDAQFVDAVSSLRKRLLGLAGVDDKRFTAVPIQGSGTYAVESVFQTVVPRSGPYALVLANGAYGNRMADICRHASIDFKLLSFPEDAIVDEDAVRGFLELQAEAPSLVAVVHCETTSGIMNPVTRLGALVKHHAPDAAFVVDAMSSFGAEPMDLDDARVDYLVSSANKCLQGVPGFAFVISRKDHLLKCKGNSRSLSLDLLAQYLALEGNGQFRFTPPTHAILALEKAIDELEREGGVEGRARRYYANRDVLREGMGRLGFQELLPRNVQGPTITSYRYPDHKAFKFSTFYDLLNEMGQVIYPGKVTSADCFRVGNIGHLFPEDMRHLVTCVEKALRKMGLRVPLDDGHRDK